MASTSPRHSDTTREPRWRTAARPMPWLLLTGLAFFWRFGYGFGSGDHDEFIPAVLALLDPTLFTGDWFVQHLTSGFNVRTPFLVAVASLALAVPLEAAVFALYVACMLGLLYGLYALGRELGAPSIASLAGVFAVVVLTPTWTLGGNSIVYGLLVPELVAWALVVPVVVMVFRGRLVAAAMLLGLASWFHVLAGFLTALSLGVALLLAIDRADVLRTLRPAVLRFGLPYVAVVLPLVALVGLAPLAAEEAGVAGASSFYIIAELRLPHHYLPLSFGAGRYARMAFLAGVGITSFVWLRKRGEIPHARILIAWLVAIGVLCSIGFVFTEVVPSLLVARLQFFKLTVLAQVILTMMTVMAVFRLAPAGVLNRAGRVFDKRFVGWGLAVAVATVTIVVAATGFGRPAAMYQPGVYRATDLAEVERWARARTPSDAIFAVPPSNTTFRSNALRSVVMTYKSVPFDDGALHEWFARLSTVAPAELPARGTGGIQERFDAAFHAHSPDAWRHIADQYGAGYALADTTMLTGDPPGPAVHRAGRWAVFEIRPEEVDT